jgi:hypothetical protein
MIVGTVAVVGTGLLYAVLFRPYDRLDAPEGDAHLAHMGESLQAESKLD